MTSTTVSEPTVAEAATLRDLVVPVLLSLLLLAGVVLLFLAVAAFAADPMAGAT